MEHIQPVMIKVVGQSLMEYYGIEEGSHLELETCDEPKQGQLYVFQVEETIDVGRACSDGEQLWMQSPTRNKLLKIDEVKILARVTKILGKPRYL